MELPSNPGVVGFEGVEAKELPDEGTIEDLAGLATLLAMALGECLVAGLVGVVVSDRAANLPASGSRLENQLGIFQPVMVLQPVELSNTTESTNVERRSELPQDFILVILYRFTLPLLGHVLVVRD